MHVACSWLCDCSNADCIVYAFSALQTVNDIPHSQDVLQGECSPTWKNLLRLHVTYTESAMVKTAEADGDNMPQLVLTYPELQEPTADQLAGKKCFNKTLPENEEVLVPYLSVDSGVNIQGTNAIFG